jgi:hypothetical protein
MHGSPAYLHPIDALEHLAGGLTSGLTEQCVDLVAGAGALLQGLALLLQVKQEQVFHKSALLLETAVLLGSRHALLPQVTHRLLHLR